MNPLDHLYGVKTLVILRDEGLEIVELPDYIGLNAVSGVHVRESVTPHQPSPDQGKAWGVGIPDAPAQRHEFLLATRDSVDRLFQAVADQLGRRVCNGCDVTDH